MKALASVLSFRPAKLREAATRLAGIHPATRSRPRTPDRAAVAALRKRVTEATSASDPQRALKTLAHDLFERELLAVVRSIGAWADLRAAVAVIARERPLLRYVPELWRVWQAFPTLDPLVELLRDNAERFGMDRAVADPYPRDVMGWLRDSRPADAIVRWTGGLDIAWDQLSSIPDSPFAADTPLIRHIFHRTLQIGSSEQLLDIEEDTVLEGWGEMSGEAHAEACANFLERVPAPDWRDRETAMGELRDTYGIPPKPGTTTGAEVAESIPAFWKRVSEERREEFRQYFIAMELAIAFRGDSTPDRRRFWMGQRREIVSVGHGTAGDTPFCVIAFPGFSVVEFFALGNAAYLYPSDHRIARYWAQPETRERPSFPKELKSWTYEFGPPGDNRIVHMGDWQHRAQDILVNWKEHYP